MKILWILLTGRKEIKKKIWLKSDVDMKHINVVNRDNLTTSMKTVQMKYNLRRLWLLSCTVEPLELRQPLTSVWLILYPPKIRKNCNSLKPVSMWGIHTPEHSCALASLPVGPSEPWATNTTWRSVILFLTERVWSQAKLTQQCLMTLCVHLLWRMFSKRKEFNRIYHAVGIHQILREYSAWPLISYMPDL